MAEALFPLRGKRVFVAGETGLVGKSLLAQLQFKECEIISAPHADLDLRDAGETYEWLRAKKPDAIFVAAAKVGGIGANSAFPAEFLHDNLAIAQSVIHSAHKAGVPRLLFLGSSCIYPRACPQPIIEESLLTGPLEPTNEAYAIAKIAGLKMVQTYRRQYGCKYIAAMPTNLYGPHDRFDPEGGHVIPAMMEKFHEAKLRAAKDITLWGTGTPLREFLYAPDLARALITMMEQYDDDIALNIGSGEEVTIRELAGMMADAVGFEGVMKFDSSKPDGTPRKFLNSKRVRELGWRPAMSLADGLRETYVWYLKEKGASSPAGRSSASSGR